MTILLQFVAAFVIAGIINDHVARPLINQGKKQLADLWETSNFIRSRISTIFHR